jgi:DNA-3-methyladenine glycosylase I
MTGKKLRRCGWGESDPMYLRYHDGEWGVPVHNDRRLFEMLTLEGMQAGLSWLIVLRKREEYRKAFDNFDVSRIARYTEKKVQELLLNPGIIRNRLKIIAAIDNAKAFLEVQKEFGSFRQQETMASGRGGMRRRVTGLSRPCRGMSPHMGVGQGTTGLACGAPFNKFLWSFVGGKPRQNRFKRLKEIPNRTPESEAMSRELKKRGFRFVGSTICYAFMQAVGMVNDHLVSCYRHEEIAVAIKKAVK